MHDYDLSRLPDSTLLRRFNRLVSLDRRVTASLLAHIAEVDGRRLYAPAGYPSMFAYCVEKLRFSEDAAAKRIQAARTSRRFPVLFKAIADGRLHLSAVCILAPHLTSANVDELLDATSGRSRSQIEHALAVRYPQAEVLALEGPIVEIHPVTPPSSPTGPAHPRSVEHAPGHVMNPAKPLSARRFEIRFSIGQAAYEKFERVQDLAGSRDAEMLFECAMDALIIQFEKRKFAVTDQPRKPRDVRTERGIPAHVKRAVYKRDGGRCTFTSADGHRCSSRRNLQFDHVTPVAHGGQATVENLRSLCQTHNQLEADRTFGAEFMERRRAGG